MTEMHMDDVVAQRKGVESSCGGEEVQGRHPGGGDA